MSSIAATPYRPTAPSPATHLVWPTDFGQRFTIFVDTEEEFDWSRSFDRSARSVETAAAIPAAAARFAALGAPLTFLVDHPIATDPASIEPLRRAIDDHGAAVGTQLHPWVNPPFDEPVNERNSFAGNLPATLEVAKLACLTDAIADSFGARPRIYRAGRYGLGAATFTALSTLGYRIDTSMRARYDYSAQGGPDYRAIGNDAFVTPEGLVELPLTTVHTGLLRRFAPGLHEIAGQVPRGRGALARAGFLNRVALTPEDMPIADALEAVRVAVGEGLPLLNMSFHSPTLVPGHTPYTRTAAELAAFWRWWDAVYGLLAKRGVRAASHDDLLAAVDGALVGPAGLEPAT